jgi:hypothetical protein
MGAPPFGHFPTSLGVPGEPGSSRLVGFGVGFGFGFGGFGVGFGFVFVFTRTVPRFSYGMKRVRGV